MLDSAGNREAFSVTEFTVSLDMNGNHVISTQLYVDLGSMNVVKCTFLGKTVLNLKASLLLERNG